MLIADDGTPRLCDFEMSKNLATMSVSMAAGGGGFTPGFLCPRVLNGAATWSPASDMYAFGVVILNTIRPPRQGEQYPLKDVAAIRSEPAVAGMVERLLSDDPSARPSAVELQAEPYFVSESVDEWGRVDVGDRRSEKRCREELLGADADALGVPEIANVVAQVDARLDALGIADETVKNHRFAVFVYTIESRVYPKFNAALRERPPGALFDAWSPYLLSLIHISEPTRPY